MARYSSKWIFFLPTLFAAAHLLLCIAIFTDWIRMEGSWGGFLIYAIDLPVSFIPLMISNWLPGSAAYPLIASIVGTLWWFFVVLMLEKAFLEKPRARDK